ncbi:uncharacterized protein [Eurosta solidaginis]|uniref:uncharacterized protein n=1 Tax=Eurosta solidaginis TaxID=178769 RepID=UPI003530B2D5
MSSRGHLVLFRHGCAASYIIPILMYKRICTWRKLCEFLIIQNFIFRNCANQMGEQIDFLMPHFDQESDVLFVETPEEILVYSPNKEVEALREIICGRMQFDERVLQRVLDCGLDAESMCLLNDADLADIFPKTEIGLRIKFRERLSHWRQNEAPTLSPLSSNRSEMTSFEDFKNSEIAQNNLEEILNASPKGKNIINYHKENFFLLDSHREALIGIIVNYFTEKNECMAMKDIANFSEQIITLFPSENMRYYCNRREGKNPTGKLYDKATNVRRKHNKKREHILLDDTDLSSRKDSAPCTSDQNAVADKLWLAHNMEPWSEVVKKWNATIEIRQQDIFNRKVNIFTDWPLLKNSLGYTLIAIDFIAKYKDSANNLINEWPDFRRLIIPYMRDKIKDNASNNMLLMIDENVDSDSTDCIITLLMHSILKPPLISTGNTPNSKRFKWKPSICDAQNVTVLHCEYINDYQRRYDELKSKAMEKCTTLQPLILVIGEELKSLESYYIVFDGVLYKVPTFVRALAILFKLFHVFNLKYPIEAKFLYDFMEKYFFKFDCSVNSNLLLLINYLENAKKCLTKSAKCLSALLVILVDIIQNY